MPRDQAKARGTASDCARRELGAQPRDIQFGAVLFVGNQRIGSHARLAADPCLDDIETLGSLMDIVEIGDIMEGTEQLDQAFHAISNGIDWRRPLVFPETDATTLRPEFSGHTNPRSTPDYPTPMIQAYVNDHRLKTTNMVSDEILHKIFGFEQVGE